MIISLSKNVSSTSFYTYRQLKAMLDSASWLGYCTWQYVIFDILYKWWLKRQAPRLAWRRSKNSTIFPGGPPWGWLPAASASAWREAWSAPLSSDAIDRSKVPRIENSRCRCYLENHIPDRPGCNRNCRCIQQENAENAEKCNWYMQETTQSLWRNGISNEKE